MGYGRTEVSLRVGERAGARARRYRRLVSLPAGVADVVGTAKAQRNRRALQSVWRSQSHSSDHSVVPADCVSGVLTAGTFGFVLLFACMGTSNE